ncbi:hypothetical protein B0H11DRAFT_2224432 [Mycena galericulata]|nr:hypothetical protein B0H11DRAFT_2224432 [Mycena galericulata]
MVSVMVESGDYDTEFTHILMISGESQRGTLPKKNSVDPQSSWSAQSPRPHIDCAHRPAARNSVRAALIDALLRLHPVPRQHLWIENVRARADVGKSYAPIFRCNSDSVYERDGST